MVLLSYHRCSYYFHHQYRTLLLPALKRYYYLQPSPVLLRHHNYKNIFIKRTTGINSSRNTNTRFGSSSSSYIRQFIYQTIQRRIPWWKYVIGITIATPCIAILQGTYLLHEYRRNHGDAPIPDVPSRGLVVVSKRRKSHNATNNNNVNNNNNEQGATILSLLQQRWNSASVANENMIPTATRANQDGMAAPTARANTVRNRNTRDGSEHDDATIVTKDDNRGVLENDRNTADDEFDDTETLRTTTTTRPLRILIIGDSLAAGVGIRHRSTPVLPETIAQALSKALNGRAVIWTCFGIPGQTSSEIVHSIQHLDELLLACVSSSSSSSSTLTLVQRFQEWQTIQRQLLQDRIDAAKQKTKAWIVHRKSCRVVNDNTNDDDYDTKKLESSNRLMRWWKRTRMQLNNDIQTLRSTLLKQRVLGTAVVRTEATDDECSGGALLSSSTTTTGTTNCGMSADVSDQAMMMGEYDIAIVLTGLNDLKEGYLPFMRSSQRNTELQQLQHDQQQQQLSSSSTFTVDNDSNNSTTVPKDPTPTFNDGLRGELVRILNALLDKRMHKHISSSSASPPSDVCDTVMVKDDSCNTTSMQQQQQQQRNQHKGPLIVFPALPYQPTVLSQYPPLSWFMIPLFNMVDENKRILSELYPGLVLFVESPDMQDWSNYNNNSQQEQQHGTVWEDFFVLYKLNDIAHDANERIKQLMKRHYERWVVRRDGGRGRANDDDKGVATANQDIDSTTMVHPPLLNNDVDADDSLYELDIMGDVTTIRQRQQESISSSIPTLSSLMVAADGIHPSDIGYDIWGRHIADAIIKEWEKV